ncbi:hypothetical protein [Catelliglobosispora koreensis]|uniref:hypothetical protein n=1 Tax=Catelliglobosispora koreensis TaxID=129052 RepID=UPI0012FCFEC8|nr:hypothetical protein [Catelliglobosispora koreensis]
MPARSTEPGPIGPETVQTRDDLARALRALRQSRNGLGLDQLDKAARKLNPTWRLPRSTVSDFESLTKTALPQHVTLGVFLSVCGVALADQAAWFAALARARTADLRRPSSAVRVLDADPSTLGVHAAIRLRGQDPFLTSYAGRDFDPDLRQAIDRASENGGLVIMVGPSCAGKTRSLLEALKAQLPEWWLYHPAPGDPIDRDVASGSACTVVWLDNLVSYLRGDNSLRAATVRRLIRSGCVVVGTIWPRHLDSICSPAGQISAVAADPDDAGELLRLGLQFVVPGEFSTGERATARTLASLDPRLEMALEEDQGFTQILAAAPDLVRRWETPHDPYGAAVITAVLDAWRVGMTTAISKAHLQMAVPGYLTARERAEAPQDWLDGGVSYAVARQREAASALIPVGGEMGRTDGFEPADFLLDRAYRTRRAAALPHTAWDALAEHATDPGDLRRLAYLAGNRSRYEYVERFLAKLAALGWAESARWLAALIAQRNPSEAIAVLGPFTGQPHIAATVTDLHVRIGDIAELRALADGGDLVAACRWIGITGETAEGDIQEAAARGDLLAEAWLVDEHADARHVEQLLSRANSGDRIARGRAADILAGLGSLAEACALLSAAEQDGDQLAGHQLVDLQIRYGTTQAELRKRAAAGDEYADHAIVMEPLRGGHTAARIAGGLLDAGNQQLALDVLQAHDDAHVALTDDYLLDALVACGRLDRLREIAATGEPGSNVRLAELAAASGAVEELHRLSVDGNWFATLKLLDIMTADGETDAAIEYAQARAQMGDMLGGARMAELLSDAGREDDLRALAAEDPWHASGTWAQHLARQGRLDEAMAWLRSRRGDGADLAAMQLADLLLAEDRLDEAVEVLRPHTMYGDGPSVSRLVELLFQHQRVDELRVEVNAGACGALDKLLDLLLERGTLTQREADHVRRTGVTAQWPDDGSLP